MAKWIGSGTLALLLAGCGGSATPGSIAASACEAEAKSRLGGKPYVLDTALLAASMKEDGRGTHLLTAPIVVSAGLADESTQQLECTARLAGDPPSSAEVVTLRFIW